MSIGPPSKIPTDSGPILLIVLPELFFQAAKVLGELLRVIRATEYGFVPGWNREENGCPLQSLRVSMAK